MGIHSEEDIEEWAMKGYSCIKKRDGFVTMDAVVHFTCCMRAAKFLTEADSVRLLTCILRIARAYTPREDEPGI